MCGSLKCGVVLTIKHYTRNDQINFWQWTHSIKTSYHSRTINFEEGGLIHKHKRPFWGPQSFFKWIRCPETFVQSQCSQTRGSDQNTRKFIQLSKFMVFKTFRSAFLIPGLMASAGVRLGKFVLIYIMNLFENYKIKLLVSNDGELIVCI